MGNYICHRPSRRWRRRVAVSQRWAPSPEDETARRQAIALDRQRQAQIETERSARMAARREQRSRDAWRADARQGLEARARLLFPWDLLSPERKLAALLAGQPEGSLYPITEMARLFAGVNVGVLPEELGVSGPLAKFTTMSAPLTRSWSELTRAADFFITAQALEGQTMNRAALMSKARRMLAKLEDQLPKLPDKLIVHKLRGSWFVIRPAPGMIEAVWEKVTADRGLTHTLSTGAP